MNFFYPSPRLGWVFRFFGTFFICFFLKFDAVAQSCKFTPDPLPTVNLFAPQSFCGIISAKIAVPTVTGTPPCTVAYKLPGLPVQIVPTGATEITVTSLPLGQTTLEWGFWDGLNFIDVVPQQILVIDNIAPNVICPPSQSFNLLPKTCDTLLTYTNPNFFDACPLNPPLPVRISGLASGSKFSIGNNVVVYRATDISGNSSTCSFTLTVVNAPTPSLTCRDTVKLFFDASCERTMTATDILLGNNYGCPNLFDVKIKKTPTGNFVAPNFNANDASKLYTYQLLNPANNQTCTGKVIARDTIRPTVDCSIYKDTVFTLGALQCATLPSFALPSANDNCNIPTFTGSPIVLKNGKLAEPFPPGITTQVITATDASGNTRACSFKITVNPFLTTQTLVCVGSLNVSLDATCKLELEADELLSGNSYACWDYYGVFLFRNNQWTNNLVDSADVGQTYNYMVQYPPTGQTCWGTVLIEDKVPPAVFCKDTTLACYQNADSLLLGLTGRPLVVEGCGVYDLTFTDHVESLGCNGSKITRQWIATDGFGNSDVCQQIITRSPGNLNDVKFPKDTILPCTIGTYPTPAISGNATLNGFANSPACGIALSSTDVVSIICDGTKKVFRTWQASNLCTQQVTTKTQVITVMDNEAPRFTCLKDSVISSNANQCCGNYRIPQTRFWDNCSRIKKVEARIPNPSNPNNPIVTVAKLIHVTFPGAPLANDTVARFDTIYCLPAGLTTITLVASDNCGNTSSCTYVVRVRDLTFPVAVCQATNISLSNDDPNDCYSGDVSTINAKIISPGSFDDCSPVRVTAQRVAPFSSCVTGLNTVNGHDPCNDNIPDPISEFALATQEATSIKFYCCETGSPVKVQIRVYQLNPDGTVATTIGGQPLMGSCQTTVTVQDVNPPTCTPPPNVTVTCSAFDPSAPPSISPVSPDQCCTPTFTSVWQNTTSFCGGTNARIFTVTDCNGNSSSCSQQVVITGGATNYTLKFPDDLSQTGCSNATPTPPTTLINTGCQKFKSTFTDSIAPATAGNCFRIFRRWLCYDSCGITAPPPAANFTNITNPAGITGPSVGPGNPNYNTTTFAYRYVQEISVVDNAAPQILSTCTPQSADLLCDTTNNDPLLFNISGFGDLCEVPTQQSISSRDDCAGSDVTISYILSLDYNENGVADLVVNSTSPPAGWGISAVVNNNQKTATLQSPSNNLPQGRHILEWKIADKCGNIATCKDTLRVRDCKPPTAKCFATLTKNIGSSKSVQLLANELNNGSTDNCTPNNSLIFSTTIKNSGLPPSAFWLFNCNDLGVKIMELTVRDQAGNTSKCETAVTIADPSKFCTTPIVSQVTGQILTMGNKGLKNASVQFGTATTPNQFGTAMSDSTGFFQLQDLPADTQLHITPAKNDVPLNGVTTWDVFLMQQHILGVVPFSEVWKFIAADVNNSKSITTNDIVELRKVILGINPTFPANTSWRFVPKTFVFPNPLNPFLTTFPEKIVVDSLTNGQVPADFLAVKTGDVSGNAATNFANADDRTELPKLIFETEEKDFSAGENLMVEIKLQPGQLPAGGFQMTFDFDFEKLELLEIQPKDQTNESNFADLKNQKTATASWSNTDLPVAEPSFALIFKTLEKGKLSKALNFSDKITPREAFFKTGEKAKPQLNFKNKTTEPAQLEVFQNRPNPFRQATEIQFSLPTDEQVTLEIARTDGQVVLRRTEFLPKGYHIFEVKNAELGGSSGLFLYSIQTASERVVRRMILLD